MKQTARLLGGIVLMAGCSGEPITTENTAHFVAQASASQSFGAAVNKDLATLRQVTAPFHDFETASHDGWSAPITACMTDPGGAGGMGFHYGNVALIDGSVSVDKPQLLLYEPEQNGRLRLVAVAYVIPYTFVPRSAEAPVLFSQKFQQVDAFQLWGLHAWVGKENPSGMFASWNPNVTCEHTTAVSTMVH